MKSLVKSFSLTAISVLASMGPSMAAQQADAPDSRRLVEPSDYGQFERLEEPVLSPDGRFVAAPVARVDGSRFISLYDLSTSAEPVTLEQADEATFSQDSRWLAFAIVPTEREVTALEKEKKPVRRRAQLRSLGTGEGALLHHARFVLREFSRRFNRGSSLPAATMWPGSVSSVHAWWALRSCSRSSTGGSLASRFSSSRLCPTALPSRCLAACR